MANPFAKFAQPEAEQNPFAQFAQPQEEIAPQKPEASTKNPLIGLIGRTASLTGSFVDSVAEVAERVGDKLELAMPLSGISPEDIKNKKQLQPLFDWAKSLKGFDESLGYQPSTQLKELGSNPLNAIPFIAERVITSMPDMVAAVRVPTAYVMARSKEILDERVKNDGKTLDDATVGDVTASVTAAIIEGKLEAFATKGLFKPTAGATKTGRIAKETGIQAGTETLEEEAAYLGEAAGTKKGLSAEEALTRGAEAAIVGGGLGATVQGTKELLAPKIPPTTGGKRQTILDALADDTQEPANLFADQGGGQAAGQPGQDSQVDLYAKRAADALESTNAIAGRGSPVSAKYGDADQTLPPSNEPPGLFEDVESGAAVTPTSTTPSRPAAPAPAQSLEAYSNFVRQYTDLRDEYNSLPSGVIDQAGMNQRKAIQKDLAAVVDANMGLIRSKGIAQQLKNPVFNGAKVLAKLEPSTGQPRAMQGNLFGLYQAAARRMKNAMALAQQDVNGAIAELEDNRARIQEKVDSDGYTDAMIISMRPANMSAGKALKNRDSIIQDYLQTSNAEIDHAIDMLQRGTGQPRAMQGKLFGQPEGKSDVGTDKPEDIEDVFNAANADELNKSRMRAAEKSKEIEAANKGRTQQVGASMTASERVETFGVEKNRIEGELNKARAELERLRGLAARPAGEKVYRPTSEDFAQVSDVIKGYERTLQGVRDQLQDAEYDLENGIETPAPRQRQEIQRVKLKAEQEGMFDAEEAAAETARTTERRQQIQEAQQETEKRKAEKEQVDYYADVEEDKPAKTVRKGKPPPEKSVEAPKKDEAIDHARRTPEGRLIISFFNAVEPQNQEESEKNRHSESKNTAENEILEFDLTDPGEFSSTGVSVALKYLIDRVGGMDKLRELVGALQSTDVSSHPALYKKYGLSNLSTRRGMDTFRDETLEHFSQAFGTEGGVRIRRPLGRAPATGEFKGVIPYEEDIKSDVITARLYDTTIAGKPREPDTATSEVVRKLSDNKLRAAALILRQLRDSGGKISDGAKAAITYLSNTHRSLFGQALRDLAFDLAFYDIDPEGHGAGSLFYKEGGQYAKDFREWIKENLHPETLELLDTLVAEHKQNEVESKKHAGALIAYNDNLKKLETKRRKQEKEEVKEAEEAKRKKKTRKERATSMREAEVEAGESETTLEPFTEVNLENLPTIQMLTEVLTQLHPSIIRTLERGDTRAALELLAQAKSNKYYAELAQRLLDTGFTAKTRFVETDALESLSNDPQIKKSLNKRLDALRDLVVALYPQEQHAAIISELKSGKLRNLIFVLDTVQDTLKENGGTESNQQLVNSVVNLVNKQFAWDGKYDPASDAIVMRQGNGKLTNHLMLHESIHAAASHLLDNPDRLVGIQRAGYDQLNELFQYSKKVLAQKGITSEELYGLNDLHEFLSEALTNPELQALLRSIRYKAAPFSLWNRFTNSIRQLFKVKSGDPSNVMVEVMLAADAMMAGTMSTEGMNVTTGPKAMATKGPRRRTTVPPGMPNQPSTIRRWMMADTWTSGKMRELRSLDASARVTYLGALTLRQIDDLVGGRLPQIKNFIGVTEKFLARKSQVVKESGDILIKWERLQAADPDMSRQLGAVMHGATILGIDPDIATPAQRVNNAKLMNEWRALDPKAKTVYREVREFYERRYSQYKRLMQRRIAQMRDLGVSGYEISKMLAHIDGVSDKTLQRMDAYKASEDTINTLLRSGFTKKVEQDLMSGGADKVTILEIRNEFEKRKQRGPYFPLMRFGRFWYQVGKGQNREYYMFESAGARDAHLAERLKQSPALASTVGENIGNDYKSQMDFHARESSFLRSVFSAVDDIDMTGLSQTDAEKRRTELKDNLYQTYLANQPDRSMRNAFVHRNNIAGYSEDALRSFSSSSFSMAYQMSRFEFSPEMFSQLDAARAQIKGRFKAGKSYDPAVVAENDELRDYVAQINTRLAGILNPTDTGKWVSYFSNIGFIYYLTSIGSALVNVVGGAMIGVPTLIGQQVRANPKMGYTEATGRVLYNTFKTMSQVMATGFGIESGGRVIDSKLLSPSLNRSTTMSAVDRAAYNRFVADGLIDITAAYDQSGLASNPTSEYNSIPNRAMQVVAYAFHHAERFNREIMAMSAFRSAMEKRANYTDKQKAFSESVAEAKDLTHRSMFDYSAPNKPLWLQSAPAKIIFQFKQFPQHMTFFLARNFFNSIKNPSEEQMEDMSPAEKKKFLAAHNDMKREARARFVGTMGMAAIFSGITGLWGFSTVADIINAVAQMTAGDDDEPFDFELEFANWAVNTFGKNMGTMVSRGIGNAAGIDLHSRLKLDGMWFRDGRNNQDSESAVQSFLVGVLGPLAGLGVSAGRAVDLYHKGQADRAIETMLPGFAKQPVIAVRYAGEGARTLQGDIMKQEFSPFELMMQSLGIRPADLAEIQFRNIKVKGQEQKILKKRDNVLNIFGLTVMTNDEQGTQEAIKQIVKFNTKYPTLAIDVDTIFKSIEGKYEKSAQTDYGLYIDPKLRYLFKDTYIQKITEENKAPAEKNPFAKFAQ